ncbi:MAG TPA: peptidase S16 [Gammaproteobacteria bacterium]|nr:peptidase S16 [Gammaproteobacteria bacterium]
MSTTTLPLFPLHCVLFPGGRLDLRLFEPRYLDMLSRCMREGSGFGVCLIKEGREAGAPALPYDVGTVVEISDWQAGEDGVLAITVLGHRRFRILSRQVERDRLLRAEVALLEETPAAPVPPPLLTALRDLWENAFPAGDTTDSDWPAHDATLLLARLADWTPLDAAQKQYLLQLNDPMVRLERLVGMWRARQDDGGV